MKVTCESLPGSRVALTVEEGDGEYQKALEQAWRQLANRVNIPGFRRGKAPKAIVMRAVGPEAVEEEALRVYLPQLYREAVSEANIEPIGDPQFDVTQRDPLVVKVTVTVRPEIKLGNYRQIRLTREEPRVAEAQVDTQLEQLRQRHAEWVPVERPVAEEDLVTIDAEGFTGHRPLLYSAGGQELVHADKGEVVLNEQDWAYPVEPDMGMPIPGFAEQLVGMSANEEKEFRLAVPGDDPRFENSKLAGKEISFRVKVKEIKEQHLPEVNDGFATLVGTQDNLEALRAEIREMLLARAAAEEEARLSDLVVDMASAQAPIDLPDELVGREVDRMVQSLQRRLDRQNFSFHNYLQIAQKSEEELRREYRSQAERNIKSVLIVDAIGDAEGIQVTPEEVEEEILRIGLALGDGARARREYADPESRANLEARLRYDKTVRWLVEQATQPESQTQAEPPAEAAATEQTPPSEEGAHS
ncbi:MAG: trigger factor [Bacteroidetes bacterium]|nr:trigger factor [Bacteroidota bacterium]MCL5025494.1 trigger factor [Chloroflexota bacterium]